MNQENQSLITMEVKPISEKQHRKIAFRPYWQLGIRGMHSVYPTVSAQQIMAGVVSRGTGSYHHQRQL